MCVPVWAFSEVVLELQGWRWGAFLSPSYRSCFEWHYFNSQDSSVNNLVWEVLFNPFLVEQQCSSCIYITKVSPEVLHEQECSKGIEEVNFVGDSLLWIWSWNSRFCFTTLKGNIFFWNEIVVVIFNYESGLSEREPIFSNLKPTMNQFPHLLFSTR